MESGSFRGVSVSTESENSALPPESANTVGSSTAAASAPAARLESAKTAIVFPVPVRSARGDENSSHRKNSTENRHRM